jgi:hypothetical protein
MRALGVSPSCCTARSPAISRAAAPSLTWLAQAAVMRPSGSRVGSDLILSQSGSRGPLSAVSPPSGAISGSKSLSALARSARVCDSTANRSMSSREMSQCVAIISAPRNWLTSPAPKRVVHPVEVENGSSKPSALPASAADMIGTMLMFCTPPATTRSIVPLITAWAAKCTACCAEPHCRSMVTPGTCTGYPAASQHVRATSNDCGPTESTLPNTTSSTSPGSMPVRSISARMPCAPRSAG